MTTRADESSLRETDVVADDDRLKIQEPNVLTDPAIVPDAELPGPKDSHAMTNEDVQSNVGSEDPQNPRSQAPWKPPLHKCQIGDRKPNGLHKATSPFVISVAFEIVEAPSADRPGTDSLEGRAHRQHLISRAMLPLARVSTNLKRRARPSFCPRCCRAYRTPFAASRSKRKGSPASCSISANSA
jgi:hypothetical protein